jgi:formylglycine-generating enzyme required for sulfatase activity
MIEWQSNPPKEYMTWYEAVDYAESLGDGWRLPTRSELVNAYDGDVIGFKKNSYWSSNTYAESTNLAWYVYFHNGNVYYCDKTFNSYVRCVREIRE